MSAIAISVIIVLGVLYVCAGTSLYLFQRTFLYFTVGAAATPAGLGLPEAEIRKLKTSDGETLSAVVVRRPGPYIAIYFHGNGGSLAYRGDRLGQLVSLGFSVLAIDYRGYGGSTGKPSETGLHLDADAAYEEAIALGFSPDHIVLLGESLGSGVALELASRRQVAGIMLDSPYSSVVDVAAGRYWMFPVRALLTDQYRSDEWIGRVHVPILILHGTRDRTVPFQSGRRLADLGGPNVTFVPIAGAGHVVFGRDAAAQPIRAWLTRFGL